MTFIVQQPDANTNPTGRYRVVLQADVAEALSKNTVVMEDYGRYGSYAKAQADADKWNSEGRPAKEGETA